MKNNSIACDIKKNEIESCETLPSLGHLVETNDSLWDDTSSHKTDTSALQADSEMRHDVNNALSALVVNLELLDMQILDPAQKKRLAIIETLAFRISSIIAGASELSRPGLREIA